jgi:RHS repeat-associated protein
MSAFNDDNPTFELNNNFLTPEDNTMHPPSRHRPESRSDSIRTNRYRWIASVRLPFRIAFLLAIMSAATALLTQHRVLPLFASPSGSSLAAGEVLAAEARSGKVAANQFGPRVVPASRTYYTPPSFPSTLAITIYACTDNGFNDAGPDIRLFVPETEYEEGEDVTQEFEWIENGHDPYNNDCEYEATATGTIPLAVGVTEIQLNVCDAPYDYCYNVGAVYTVTDTSYAPPEPPIPVVTTLLNSRGLTAGTTGASHGFIIRNRKSTSRTFSISATCTGALTCTGGATSVTVGAEDEAAISRTVSMGSTVGSLGTLTVFATDNADGTHTGSAVVEMLAAPAPVSDFAAAVSPALLSRGQCVMLAAGEAGAVQCGDLQLAHALPAARSLGKARAPTLIYNSQHAHPHPLIPVVVTLPATSTAVTAELRVNSVLVDTRSITPWAASEARRVVVGFDATTYTTGLYDYTVTVKSTSGGVTSTVHADTGELVVVNRSAHVNGAGHFGAGWWLAGLEQLIPVSNNRKLWIGGDGSHRIYSPAGTGKWAAPKLDRPDTLSVDGTGYCRQLRGRGCVVFDSAGRHVQTRGRLAGVHPWGFVTSFTYDGSGRLTSVVVPIGNSLSDTWTMNYTSGRLVSVVSAAGSASSRTVTVTPDTLGRITAIQDPDLLPVGFGYTGSSARIRSRTNRLVATTRFAFDAGGRVSEVKLPLTSTDTATTTIATLESRGFGSGGTGTAFLPVNAYTMVDGPRSDVADSVLFWLTGHGAPRRIRDAAGHETLVAYDSIWPALVSQSRDPAGLVTTANFDGRGNLASQTVVDPYGATASATTTYAWNQEFDQLDTLTPPLGPVITVHYDSQGNREWQQSGADTLTRVRFSYYPTGHAMAGLLRTILAPHQPVPDSLEYDSGRGNLLRHRSALGFITSYDTDVLGRDSVVTSPIDSLQAQHSVTVTLYDLSDRPVVVTTTALRNPSDSTSGMESLVVETDYHDGMLPHSISRSAVPDSAFGGTLTTFWEYDFAGRAVAEIAADGGRDSTFYDPAGNAIRTKTRRGHELRTLYDPMGRVLERFVPGVQYTRICMEEFSNNCEVAFPFYPNGGTGLYLEPDISLYRYDHAGRITVATNADSEVRRNYFPNGQLRTDTLRVRAVSGTTYDSYGMAHHYDLAGRDTSFVYPGGDRTRHGFDPVHGSLAWVEDFAGDLFSFTYDKAGRLILRTATPSGSGSATLSDSLGYDADSRLVHRTERRTQAAVSPATLHQESRWYDARGKLLRVTATVPAVEGNIHEANYQYAGLGAVTQAVVDRHNAPTLTETWATDGLGNRYRSQSAPDNAPAGMVKRYTYVEGKLEAIAADSSHNTVSGTYPDWTQYVYDASGNATGEVTEQGYFNEAENRYQTLANRTVSERYYGADQRLRVVQSYVAAYDTGSFPAVTRRGVYEEYRYDPLGRRIMVYGRRPSGLCNITGCADYTDRFIWNGNQLVYESRNGTGGGVVRYVHGLGLDQPLKVGDYVPHADFRGTYDMGSTLAGAAKTGVDWPGRYRETFGDESSPRMPAWHGSLIQGQQDASGLQYRRNRYYDPKAGLFTQEDPIGLAGGLNLYGFAGGDPVNFSDPFGLCAQPSGGGDSIRVQIRIAHLSEICVEVGHKTKDGETVAYSGNTGTSDGPHAHWEYRIINSNVKGDAVPNSESTPVNPSGTMDFYIAGEPARITSGFGPRNVSIGSKNHLGVDVPVPIGTEIGVWGGGTVVFKGYLADYGNVIYINYVIPK